MIIFSFSECLVSFHLPAEGTKWLKVLWKVQSVCLGERGKQVNSAQVGRYKGGAWDWRAGVAGGRCSLLPWGDGHGFASPASSAALPVTGLSVPSPYHAFLLLGLSDPLPSASLTSKPRWLPPTHAVIRSPLSALPHPVLCVLTSLAQLLVITYLLSPIFAPRKCFQL